MTDPASRFRAALDATGLSRAEIARAAERLAGEEIPRRTLDAWHAGDRQPSPAALAFLACLARLPLAERKALGRRGRPS